MPGARNKIKIVLDSNVYISALLFAGRPEEIMDLVRNGSLELLISPAILLELGRVLQDKFLFSRREVLSALQEVRRLARIIAPQKHLQVITADPDDNRILECAVFGGADYIVTGDKRHLRPLGHFQGIKILLPSEFLKEIC